MTALALVGLLKMELPTGTVRLCDGGFIVWGGETYRAKDATFGALAGIDPLAEGAGQAVPLLDLKFIPPGDVDADDLSQPGFQQSRVRLWLAEFDAAAGTVSGTPDLLFDGQVDQTVLGLEAAGDGGAQRVLAMSVVASAERFFEGNLGNSLNGTWHKSVWSGELGHDNATGLSLPVAWGAEAQPGTVGYGNGAVRRDVVSPWNIRYV